ncbi:MAG: PKD domain-containing protein [Saprospiraceae bacterium]|nr:PKD domain-containing protein [Saprospiraceae bacterium]
MKTPLATALLLLFFLPLYSQETQPQPPEFSTRPEAGALRFTAKEPPLPAPIPGAPEPFYTHYWEFGDGDFSFEKSPLHRYARAGNYTAMLDLTAHYDDKKKPPGVQQSILADAGGSPDSLRSVFEKERETIALKTNRQPRPNEELVCIISYRNTSQFVTDGRLHLFFNEKKFRTRHFGLQSARSHFGETEEAAFSAAERPRVFDWSALSESLASSAGDAALPLLVYAPPDPRTEGMLAKARETYRDGQTWRFSQLRPGETRNLFVSLGSLPTMLQDTSAFIHLQGILENFDPAIPAGEFVLEIEIVSSHDPNAIAVSDNRVNYRRLGGEKLDYKVQFQNNGEGPAKKVELTITVPEGLNTTRMRPLSWYPECPICPKTAANREQLSCLDTATFASGLVFTFRNIYLPGSRQAGVTDYDSTKGFVRYRLEPEKRMPKRSFHSQAKIVFDKNKPIYTNFSKTRFKPGLSPGPKVGYGFRPDSTSESGYFFLGMSLSPYKPWKIYPQVELLTGLKGRTELPESEIVERTGLPNGPPMGADFVFDTVTTTDFSGDRGFVSVEVPLLLRKNFTGFFGAGLGVSARVFFENGTDRRHISRREDLYVFNAAVPGGYQLQSSKPLGAAEQQNQSYSATTARFSLFADLTLGAVRAGPNLGIRVGGLLDRGFQPFVQLALEVKL